MAFSLSSSLSPFLLGILVHQTSSMMALKVSMPFWSIPRSCSQKSIRLALRMFSLVDGILCLTRCSEILLKSSLVKGASPTLRFILSNSSKYSSTSSCLGPLFGTTTMLESLLMSSFTPVSHVVFCRSISVILSSSFFCPAATSWIVPLTEVISFSVEILNSLKSFPRRFILLVTSFPTSSTVLLSSLFKLFAHSGVKPVITL